MKFEWLVPKTGLQPCKARRVVRTVRYYSRCAALLHHGERPQAPDFTVFTFVAISRVLKGEKTPKTPHERERNPPDGLDSGGARAAYDYEA